MFRLSLEVRLSLQLTLRLADAACNQHTSRPAQSTIGSTEICAQNVVDAAYFVMEATIGSSNVEVQI